MAVDTVRAPPGWYVDPSRRHGQRWWDGSNWTAHVADTQSMTLDPLPGAGHPVEEDRLAVEPSAVVPGDGDAGVRAPEAIVPGKLDEGRAPPLPVTPVPPSPPGPPPPSGQPAPVPSGQAPSGPFVGRQIRATSGLATASMVLGLVGIFVVGFTGPLAVIFGHVSLAKIRRSGYALLGRGRAIAGLCLGYLEVIGLTVLLVAAATGILGTSAPSALQSRAQEYAAASGAPTPGPPRLVGKVVPVNVGSTPPGSAKIDENTYSGLAAVLRANAPTEVGTVALVKYETSVVGSYTSGRDALQESATITIVNLATHKQYPAETIQGPPPPQTITRGDSNSGGKPDVANYLNGLARG